ncbi:MAG: NAD(P)-binding protein [Bdellovibrionales bacterium]|nr:NAD(P)-binding protein [Bdellovibrionales bacterium]
MTNFLIVGAGITGIVLGREFARIKKSMALSIWEKSKGLGGRLATRRGETTRFDHGIPEITDDQMQLFGLKARDFQPEGVTAIAKLLAKDLPIEKNERAVELSRTNSEWLVKSESGKTLQAKTVIITAPLPQALDLLRQNRIAFEENLSSFAYEMAIVALLEGTGIDQTPALTRFKDEEFLTLSNERKKGISPSPAWTLTFSPEFSKKYFDLPDDSLQNQVLSTLKKKWPDFHGSLEIKKWRYSKPVGSISKFFEKVASVPDLYLAGDAFSPDPSVCGLDRSIQSALELFKELQNKSWDFGTPPHAL